MKGECLSECNPLVSQRSVFRKCAKEKKDQRHSVGRREMKNIMIAIVAMLVLSSITSMAQTNVNGEVNIENITGVNVENTSKHHPAPIKEGMMKEGIIWRILFFVGICWGLYLIFFGMYDIQIVAGFMIVLSLIAWVIMVSHAKRTLHTRSSTITPTEMVSENIK